MQTIDGINKQSGQLQNKIIAKGGTNKQSETIVLDNDIIRDYCIGQQRNQGQLHKIIKEKEGEKGNNWGKMEQKGQNWGIKGKYVVNKKSIHYATWLSHSTISVLQLKICRQN